MTEMAQPFFVRPDDTLNEMLYRPSLPMPNEAVPPRLASMVLVTMLIEPPTEGVDTFEAPRPRCTCIVRVTSDRPAQFDQ